MLTTSQTSFYRRRERGVGRPKEVAYAWLRGLEVEPPTGCFDRVVISTLQRGSPLETEGSVQRAADARLRGVAALATFPLTAPMSANLDTTARSTRGADPAAHTMVRNPTTSAWPIPSRPSPRWARRDARGTNISLRYSATISRGSSRSMRPSISMPPLSRVRSWRMTSVPSGRPRAARRRAIGLLHTMTSVSSICPPMSS